jgi:GNAT superfamily N-acetyltransferase
MVDIFRRAEVSDAHVILTLTERAYEPIRKLGLRFPAASATLEMVVRNIDGGGCYLLERDGVVAGTGSVAPPERVRQVIEYPCELPFIWWLATDPAFAEKGVGGRLLSWIEQTVVRGTLNSPAAALSTSLKHPWLVSMYERRGYRRFHEVDNGDEGIGVLLRKDLDLTADKVETRSDS